MGSKPRKKPEERHLILKTVSADMTAYGGFVWPHSGPVECPDWSPEPVCGGGLHGALNGEGYGTLFSWDPETVWLVFATDEIVDLGGKVKAPRGDVVACGTREKVTAWLAERRPGAAIIGGTATAGYGGTAMAGDRGTAMAGDRGTAKAGNYGTATAGNCGTATAGDGGTATAGDRGTATAGYGGTATAGDRGAAMAGDRGTAKAGDRGAAKAGNYGTATAGNYGTATAGYGGEIRIRWHDGWRYRCAVGYVGENAIEPNVTYRVVGGKLVRAC